MKPRIQQQMDEIRKILDKTNWDAVDAVVVDFDESISIKHTGGSQKKEKLEKGGIGIRKNIRPGINMSS